MAAPVLQDLKTHLGITTEDDDVELDGVLAGAIRTVEGRVGPLTLTPVSETHVGTAGPVLVLKKPPVHEVTSITQAAGVVLATYYEFDGDTGIVQLLAGRQFHGDFTVTYIAGWETPPADLRMAVLIVGQQLWETQRVPGRRPRPGQQDGQVHTGFAVPRRAAELMAPYLLGQLP